ncbi:hypothetical protein CDAR_236881 [Caerostris darwini]|uniref:Uncharacterized protein n=1 Tax=Caerostris darwini TaxID=1538125 RepID=A0AAV4S386_9ARAC|nr:hypothetical protein CDAR_236881 [Caerostris darwini]
MSLGLKDECQHPSVVYFFFFFSCRLSKPSFIDLGSSRHRAHVVVNDMLYSVHVPHARVPPVAWSMSSLAVDEHLISSLPSIYDTS